LNTDINLHYF